MNFRYDNWLRGKTAVLLALFLILSISAAAAIPELAAASSTFDPHAQVGHHHNSSGGGGGGISISLDETLFHLVRMVYYAVLLFSAGLMIWSLAEPVKPSLEHRPLSERLGKIRLLALRILLIVSLLHVFLSYRMLTDGFDSTTAEMLRIFTETRMGQSWLAIVVLALLGFLVLKADAAFKVIWALLLLAAECYNGHVLALEPLTFGLVLNFIHLAAAAVWAGGLMLLLVLWVKDRDAALRFAPKLSAAAWISIAALSLSGILLTILLIPSWTYLLYTSWGVWLLIKTALVLAVIGAGFALRKDVRSGKLLNGSMLKFDGLLMAAIIIIASIFTYLSPEPDTEPLNYHKMGEELHYTLIIKPNGPGPNEAEVKVWLPEEIGEPAEVKLSLKAADRPRKESIEVELIQAEGGEPQFEFPGFKESNYESEEFQLPFPGPWRAELIIIDMNGTEYMYNVDFSND